MDDSLACTICESADRDAIEDVGLNGLPFSLNAEFISREFSVAVSESLLKRHMTEHLQGEHARRMAELLSEAEGGDEDHITARGLASLLLSDAAAKVASGETQIRSVNDIMRLLSLQESMRRADLAEQSSSGEPNSAEDWQLLFYYIIDSLKEAVPDEYLRKAVLAAYSKFLGRPVNDLSEVPGFRPRRLSDAEQRSLDLLDRDARAGKMKSREQLLADGDFDLSRPLQDPDVPPE